MENLCENIRTGGNGSLSSDGPIIKSRSKRAIEQPLKDNTSDMLFNISRSYVLVRSLKIYTFNVIIWRVDCKISTSNITDIVKLAASFRIKHSPVATLSIQKYPFPRKWQSEAYAFMGMNVSNYSNTPTTT